MSADLQPSLQEVKCYWEESPLFAKAIPHPLGSPEYFKFCDGRREANESLEFSYRLNEFRQFKGRKVLEVGCGNGYVLEKFALEWAEVTGTNLAETGIDLCRKPFAYQGVQGQFQVGSAEELPFPDGTFDCVCSMGVLHHTTDTPRAVAEIHRVFQPGGPVHSDDVPPRLAPVPMDHSHSSAA